jgi:hypothetical protein
MVLVIRIVMSLAIVLLAGLCGQAITDHEWWVALGSAAVAVALIWVMPRESRTDKRD